MTPSPLARLLKQAIERQLPADGKTAIAFSGGLDSTTIATVAKKKASIELITLNAGAGRSPDLEMAEKVAAELSLPLHAVELAEEQLVTGFDACFKIMPGSATEMELMVAAYALAQECRRLGPGIMLFGSGAEEVFVGYHKYYEARKKGLDLEAILLEEFRTLPSRDLARTRAVCAVFGVEPRFPFMDEELFSAVGAVPLLEKLDDGVAKKPLLRKLAAELGVPKMAAARPKKALQYGSGLHKAMEKLVREGRIPKLPSRVPEWMKKDGTKEKMEKEK
jgi:asparagine synthase (glutamine-hydrolysing)